MQIDLDYPGSRHANNVELDRGFVCFGVHWSCCCMRVRVLVGPKRFFIRLRITGNPKVRWLG